MLTYPITASFKPASPSPRRKMKFTFIALAFCLSICLFGAAATLKVTFCTIVWADRYCFSLQPRMLLFCDGGPGQYTLAQASARMQTVGECSNVPAPFADSIKSIEIGDRNF
jgi:hypothetical protein